MKKHLSTILLVLALLAGVSLLLYPSVSDYWNSMHATQAVTDYAQQVENMDHTKYDQMLRAAADYNRSLLERSSDYALTDAQKQQYEELLSMDGSGMIGYIEIPEIKVQLPIYHGTSDGVLQIAVGHLDWTSLPVGGESTHCVLSGHRGLPSATLFTNLDRLDNGDTFIIRVLDEVLTYEVDQILIVEPDDVSALTIEDGKDLCTLVTCTPYGINSHRLLVRGHRVENADDAAAIRVTSDAIRIESVIVAPFVAMPFLFILLLVLLFGGKKKETQGGINHGKRNRRD